MQAKRSFTNILLAGILVLTVVSVIPPAASYPVTATQDAIIKGNLGAGAPFGDWEGRNENTRFYLHTNVADIAQSSDPALQVTMDTQAPTNNNWDCTGQFFGVCRGVAIDDFGPIVVDMGGVVPPLVTDDTLTVQSISFDIYAEGSEGNLLNVDVFRVDASGTRVTPPIIGLFYLTAQNNANPLPPSANDAFVQPYIVSHTGTVDFGINPVILAPGETLSMDIYGDHGNPASIGSIGIGSNVVYMDSTQYPSAIIVNSDSARVNLWTADRNNAVTDNFPSAPTVGTLDRRVTLHGVYMNTWNAADCGGINADADTCQSDNLDQTRVRIRARDLASGQLMCMDTFGEQGMALTCDNPSPDVNYGFYVKCCSPPGGAPNPEDRPIRYQQVQDATTDLAHFTFTLVYGQDVPDGRYQLEFQESEDNWVVAHVITIGMTGFQWQFAPGEGTIDPTETMASHLVALKQPTEFVMRLTNSGVMTDTFGVTVPTPGAGWTATVAPNSVTLAPGAYHDFTATVTPAANGKAGDVKNIPVKAISVKDNSDKTLYLNVTLTGQILHGVDVTTSLPSVETRPDVTTLVPLQVRNTGTVLDQYVVTATTNGAPIAKGWTFTLTPAHLGLLAASREDVLLTVRAPHEAKAGDSFVLFVTARLIENATVQDVLELPIFVRFEDGLQTVVPCPNDASPNPYVPPPPQLALGPTPSFHNPALQQIVQDNLCHLRPRDPAYSRYSSTQVGVIIFTGGEPGVTRDQLFDHSHVFRVRVDNTGDKTDTYRMTASWTPPAANDDRDNCDETAGTFNGVPDGWRYSIVDGGLGSIVDPEDRLDTSAFAAPTTPQTGVGFNVGTRFSGELELGELTLAPHTSQYVYVELFWVEPAGTACIADPAPGNGNYRARQAAIGPVGTGVELRLSTRSINDPNLKETERLRVETIARAVVVGTDGTTTGRQHSVDIEPDVTPAAIYGELVQTPLDGSAVYKVRAINSGNEHDSLRIRYDAGFNGWKHEITKWTIVPSQLTTNPPPAAPHPALPARQCTPANPVPPSTTQIVCDRIGVQDEVVVELRVTPPATARVGDVDDSTVTVTSAGSSTTGQVTDVLQFHTRVQGDFFFELEDLAGERLTYPVRTVAFPFTLHNLGTENNEYYITLPTEENNATWLPTISSPERIAVPAGMSHHGFISVNVPDIAMDPGECDDDVTFRAPGQTAPHLRREHFRVEVGAAKGTPTLNEDGEIVSYTGELQTELLDFYATVNMCMQPPFELSADPVTIRSGDAQTFEVEAQGPAGQLTTMRYTMVANPSLQLPTGYFPFCDADKDILASESTDFNCNDEPQPGKPLGTPEIDYRNFNPAGLAIGNYHIQAPPNQLSTSRVIARVQGVADDEPESKIDWVDAVLNLATQYGIEIVPVDTAAKTIPAGTNGPPFSYELEIRNTGLSPATVVLDHSPLPGAETDDPADDWTLQFDTETIRVCPEGLVLLDCLDVLPGEGVRVLVTMTAPPTVRPGDVGSVIVYGTIQEDPTFVAQLLLSTTVGKFDLLVNSGFPQAVAPQEMAVFAVDVENVGTVSDTAELKVLLPAAYQSIFTVTWLLGCDQVDTAANTCTVGLAATSDPDEYLLPGEARQVLLGITVPAGIQPLVEVPMTLRAQSTLSVLSVVAQDTLELSILDYVAQDVDGDRGGCFDPAGNLVACEGREYAIDRDQDPSNGYEEFRESLETGALGEPIGIQTQPAPLAQYLSEEALERKTKAFVQEDGSTVEIVEYVIDGDNDGLVDHFLDSDLNGLPDIYWDPDFGSGAHQDLNFTKDATHDGVREYFVDLDSDLRFDAYFDLVEGEFGDLLQFFIDGDDIMDYVVDLNGDGVADTNEPVLIGAAGGLRIAKVHERADMDGNGDLDLVVDADADGDPDYFVPFGQDSSIQIVLREVTGDNVKDWTYSSKGEGRPDSYYDPACGAEKTADGKSTRSCSGFIDTQGEFLRNLQKYWYVGALFALVLVLFVALVVVTRK